MTTPETPPTYGVYAADTPLAVGQWIRIDAVVGPDAVVFFTPPRALQQAIAGLVNRSTEAGS